jgi:hypothetical protein
MISYSLKTAIKNAPNTRGSHLSPPMLLRGKELSR